MKEANHAYHLQHKVNSQNNKGQLILEPVIIIWDCVTLNSLFIIQKEHVSSGHGVQNEIFKARKLVVDLVKENKKKGIFIYLQ